MVEPDLYTVLIIIIIFANLFEQPITLGWMVFRFGDLKLKQVEQQPGLLLMPFFAFKPLNKLILLYRIYIFFYFYDIYLIIFANLFAQKKRINGFRVW